MAAEVPQIRAADPEEAEIGQLLLTNLRAMNTIVACSDPSFDLPRGPGHGVFPWHPTPAIYAFLKLSYL